MKDGPATTKRCARCKCLKPLASFAKKRANDYQPYCRPCQNEYRKEHYRRNQSKYIESAKRRLGRIQKLIRAAKSRPCSDCGVQYPYYVMEFDHRDGEEKLANIAGMIYSSEGKLRREIEKCDVVCANCHRERTHGQSRRKKLGNR